MKYILYMLVLWMAWLPLTAQNYSQILGRPADSAITISVLFDAPAEYYWEYGTNSGSYTHQTNIQTVLDTLPVDYEITGLNPGMQYYYRLRYRNAGSLAGFGAAPEHYFRTQRAPGSTFSFAIEADPHLDSNTIPASLSLTFQNILDAQPDFMIDLGDNFLSEKYVLIPGNQQPIAGYQQIIRTRTMMYRPYYGAVAHSVPLYLVLGNHEGELGWKLNGTDSSMPVVAAQNRKLYYPNPLPERIYTGNDSAEAYVGLRENYYAWHWGDALFVVIDPYWYTRMSQRAGWGWTLGSRQFEWFKRTLKSSTAKYKFIFAHQLVGGNGNDARGGAEYADLFENGGRNADSSWGFESNRYHWQEPLHAIMLEAGASVYFHGHDHCYAAQQKDGLMYHEVPQPSARNINVFTGSGTGYGYTGGTLLPSRGYLLVTVSPDSAVVKYIKTYLPNEENVSRHNKDIAHSYSINPNPAGSTAVYEFIGNGKWDNPANWNSNSIPPAVLPNGAEIIINPVEGGTCELNRVQVIKPGARVTVMPGKKFQVPGAFLQQ